MSQRFSLTKKTLLLSLSYLSMQFTPALVIAEQEMKVSPHEALLLKRIVEFWKDEDYNLAQHQIQDFLAEYPKSPVKDHLLAMLGDLYFKEEEFRDAIATYTQIESEEFSSKVFIKHLKAFNELKEYEQLHALAEPFFAKNKDQSGESFLQVRLLYANALHRLGKTEESLPLFESLATTEYKEFTLLPLAETYRQLGDFPKAISYYEILLQAHPEQKEELLFQIASIQVQIDKRQAVQTFAQVSQLEGKKAAPAAFNHLALLFELGDYEEVVTHARSAISKLSEEQLPLVHFYIGKSQFALKHYDAAIAPLESFIVRETSATPRLKSALLSLMVCARETEDPSLSERTLDQLASSFSQDPNTLQSLLIHAQLQKEDAEVRLTSEEVRRLLDISPNFEGKEAILYDVSLLLMQDSKWEEGRDVLSLFLEKYPQSSKRTSALKHLVNSSINTMIALPQDGGAKERFLKDFALAVEDHNVFTVDEVENFRFMEAKTFYELKYYQEAASKIEFFLETYPEALQKTNAHLMAALCYEHVESKQEESAQHFEKVLSLNPDHPDLPMIHLKLYNHYLALSLQESDNQQELLDIAADHLYESLVHKKDTIKLDNQLWLANHFYKKVQAAKQELKNPLEEGFVPLKRAIATYETLLGIHDGMVSFPKGEASLLLEGEVLKFADLLTLKKDLPKKIALLEALTQTAKQEHKLKWKYQRNALFELAKAHEMQADVNQAIDLYSELLEKHSPSHLTHTALLHKTRLEFKRLSQEQRKESAPEVIAILNNLKDLQIKKKLESEPTHLEAALDYVDVRIALIEETSKLDKQLFFLGRFKEDFTTTDDLTAQEYAAARESNPQKNFLYQSYMHYVDAEIARLRGEKALIDGNSVEADLLFNQARSQFADILKEKDQLTPYLVEKIELSMEQLR